jgi:hypothetical protein
MADRKGQEIGWEGVTMCGVFLAFGVNSFLRELAGVLGKERGVVVVAMVSWSA